MTKSHAAAILDLMITEPYVDIEHDTMDEVNMVRNNMKMYYKRWKDNAQSSIGVDIFEGRVINKEVLSLEPSLIVRWSLVVPVTKQLKRVLPEPNEQSI